MIIIYNDVINLVVDQFDEKTDMVYAGTRYFTSANLNTLIIYQLNIWAKVALEQGGITSPVFL